MAERNTLVQKWRRSALFPDYRTAAMLLLMATVLCAPGPGSGNEVKAGSGGKAARQVVDREGRFAAFSDNTIKDSTTGLIWAVKDNGARISWSDAVVYCRRFRGGGYSDWRMPTLAELETLFDPGFRNPKPPTRGCDGGYHINRLFHITCCCLWASEENGKRAAAFPFNTRERFWHHQTAQSGRRVLPVRP